jgi:O-methyltransferase domain/Dimerisation domain
MTESNERFTADVSPSAVMFHLIVGFRVSRTIFVAAKLGLADLLKDGPRTSEQLARSTGTHAPSLYRVLRALVSIGVFSGDDEQGFVLTPLGNTLRSDAPGSLRHWAMLVLGNEHYQAWGDLAHSVKTGESAFRHIFGANTYEYVSQHPEHAKVFNEAMANLTGFYNAAVRDCYSFSGIGKVVDVGGGDGSLVIALLQANPGMKGIVFDLPQVAERAKQRMREAALEERCEVISGDQFVSVPSGGDIYILSRCVNSFNDARVIQLLKNCRAAMAKKSKLLLIERVLPARLEDSITAHRAFMSDLNMLVNSGGQERTETEHGALLEAAGFRVTSVVPTESEMSVVECVPV